VTRTAEPRLADLAPTARAGVTTRARPTVGARARAAVEELWRPLALLAVLGVLWWLVTEVQLVASYLVPSPGMTWSTLLDNAGYLWDNTVVTVYETLAGFAVAAVLGIAAAVVMVYSATIERTLYPLLLFAQVIPKIAIAPLFVVWLGFGYSPKILVAVLMAFFPVVISAVAGLRSVDPEMLQLVSTMGSRPLQTFRKVRFPAALPHIFAGLKVAVTLAVTGAVVGEFVGSNVGLGYVILQANGNVDIPMLFAGLIIMSAVGVLLFALTEVAERLLLPWHASRRSTGSIAAA
jgi:NitT/TauT family transport system permease protein